MAWWRGDDKSHNNHKLLAVGLAGTGLFFRAVSWCSSEETDGRVPVAVWPSLSPTLSPKARTQLVRSMVDVGLLIPEEDSGATVIAHWLNDYLEYNPSADQLASKRETERKRIGAKRSRRWSPPAEALAST